MTQIQGKIAQSFLKMVVDSKVHKAYEKDISQDFIHHNPYFNCWQYELVVDKHLSNPKRLGPEFA